ncbi:MAG: putative FAD-dependent dehydrogenase, partial [Lentimonas sp.]
MAENTPEETEQAPLVDIVLPIEESEHAAAWKTAIATKLELPEERIVDMRLRKHSIDARQRQIKAQLRIEVGVDTPLPPEPELKPNYATPATDAKSVIIIGCGPAGMFAALRALDLGLKPIILERGKDASARRFDLGPILKEGTVIEDSNYCFGEGGAGTFSDGKLYTRAKKRGPIRDIYETFVAHGAPERILIDAHPHIGSNLLPKVVMAMRQSILEAGGEVHFGTKVNQFILND